MTDSLIYIDNNQISSLLDINEIVDICEKVFKGIAEKKIYSPKKYSLSLPGNSSEVMKWINSMPAYLETEGIVGLKWISICSENMKHGLPTTSGLIVLNKLDTAIPFAVLDASLITHYRTAASILLAARSFAPIEPKVLTVFGPGQEGTYSSIFLQHAFDLEKIFVLSRSNDSFLRFNSGIKNYCSKKTKIIKVSDIKEAINQSDIIILSSTSMKPILTNNNFSHSQKKNQFICGLTAFNDLSTSILKRVNSVIFDDQENAMNRIEEVSKIDFSKISFNATYNMSSLTSLKNNTGINLYLPIGVSAMDIAIANYIYKKYVDKHHQSKSSIGALR